MKTIPIPRSTIRLRLEKFIAHSQAFSCDISAIFGINAATAAVEILPIQQSLAHWIANFARIR
jgi:hypothetical protein